MSNNPTLTNRQTLQQARAASAWQAVQQLQKLIQSDSEDYGRWARKLPTMIKSQGLAPTLAFLKAKGKLHLYNDVSAWVSQQLEGKRTDLIEMVLSPQCDSRRYRLIASETIAYVEWLKRFAEAQGLGNKEEG